MKIDILFSFRNEEDNLELLLNRCHSVLIEYNKDIDFSFIFVNDASTDSSLEILIKLKTRYPITIVNMSRRFGVGPCLLAGLSICDADAVIYLDADLQDPPELMPKMLDLYFSGYDVVNTRRIHRHGETWIKLKITKFAYKILNILSKLKIEENVGDYKLISKKVFHRINALNEVNPFTRFIPVLLGFDHVTIDYVREQRAGGKTHFPLFSSGPYREFLRGLIAVTSKPLLFPLAFGVLGVFSTILLILYSLFIKLTEKSNEGIPTLIILLSTFSSLILISLGIIGAYLAQVVDQTRNRPIFTIKEIL